MGKGGEKYGSVERRRRGSEPAREVQVEAAAATLVHLAAQGGAGVVARRGDQGCVAAAPAPGGNRRATRRPGREAGGGACHAPGELASRALPPARRGQGF